MSPEQVPDLVGKPHPLGAQMRVLAEVDRDWMPLIRNAAAAACARGAQVWHLRDASAVFAFAVEDSLPSPG